MVIIHIYVGTVVDWDSRCGGAGDTGGQKYQVTIYVSWACVGVRVWLTTSTPAYLLGGLSK